MLFELRSRPLSLAKTAATIALAALPFAALQIAQNVGVTGKLTETPMQYYVDESYPVPLLGFAVADLKNLPPGLSAPKRSSPPVGWNSIASTR